MTFIGNRKLIQSNRSVMMCVPAAWVEQFELMAGDSIEINQGADGELILTPGELNL